MLARCCADQHWNQALGVCVEARRFAKLEELARASGDLCASLRYILKACDAVVSRHVREDALKLVVKLFAEAGELSAEDNVLRCKSLMVLDDATQVAAILSDLVDSGDERKFLLALQIAFDLFDNDVYVRLLSRQLPPGATCATTNTTCATTNTTSATSHDVCRASCPA